ncbi:hypothetical protein [Leifsonia sp. LS-T14]|uniref:hypothetical protein n=1 Tax=unclassified Leifsonia TaxID=2663824 RepID=UPI0035A58559
MREACCPQCRGVARLVRNPYYGAGLAVHADLLVCEACGFTGFADNPLDDSPAAADTTAVADSPLQRFLRLLAGH